MRANDPPTTLAMRLDRERLGHAGNAFEQTVAAGQQRDEHPLDHPVLTDDHAFDLEHRAFEQRRVLRRRRHRDTSGRSGLRRGRSGLWSRRSGLDSGRASRHPSRHPGRWRRRGGRPRVRAVRTGAGRSGKRRARRGSGHGRLGHRSSRTTARHGRIKRRTIHQRAAPRPMRFTARESDPRFIRRPRQHQRYSDRSGPGGGRNPPNRHRTRVDIGCPRMVTILSVAGRLPPWSPGDATSSRVRGCASASASTPAPVGRAGHRGTLADVTNPPSGSDPIGLFRHAADAQSDEQRRRAALLGEGLPASGDVRAALEQSEAAHAGSAQDLARVRRPSRVTCGVPGRPRIPPRRRAVVTVLLRDPFARHGRLKRHARRDLGGGVVIRTPRLAAL